MRYQLRLIDEDLPAFHKYLSRRCWTVLATLLPEGGRWGACRALYRRLKAVLSGRVEARSYCGQAFQCDAFLNPVEPGQPYRKVVPNGEAEHTNHYLLTPEATPGQLVGELSRVCLMVLAEARPAARIKGVGRRVRQEIRDILRDHLYRNESCGESPLCAINEPIDAWVGRAGKDSVR